MTSHTGARGRRSVDDRLRSLETWQTVAAMTAPAATAATLALIVARATGRA